MKAMMDFGRFLQWFRAGLLAVGLCCAAVQAALAAPATSRPSASAPAVTSLDGVWQLAIDPQDVGRAQQWWVAPRPESKAARVPWIIQDAFPAYHGVAWYWRDFQVGANPNPRGRFLLRFWGVDYKGEVWLNGAKVGEHEGGETPFVLDVTEALRPNGSNRLAVRVLNPTHTPIDGMTLSQTPHQARVIPYGSGAEYNTGGITDSVQVLAAPTVRLDDLVARPQLSSGQIEVEARVHNAGIAAMHRLEFSVAPASSGDTLNTIVLSRLVPPGDSTIKATLQVADAHRWSLNDPYLYRVTARVSDIGLGSLDERSTRCGFREFRFERGYFRLNGKRLFLRSTHTCNNFPIGLRLPPDPDMARRDLLNLKVMGFNAIRFIWGGALPYQLDLCDEIGLMVYEESFASSPLEPSPQMGARFDRSVGELVQRDRNHPSVVIWGLLNETGDGPYFQHALASLPMLRALDPTRMVFLNSGRWDLGDSSSQVFQTLDIWHAPSGREPWVTHNPLPTPLASPFGFAWAPGQIALHPGPGGEYSVVRWTAPQAGDYKLDAAFSGLSTTGPATTDVHIAQGGKYLLDALLNINGSPNSARHQSTLHAERGDTIDFIVGNGSNSYASDSTALSATITEGAGKVYDASADFSPARNPNGAWSYGSFAPGAPGARPEAGTFALYTAGRIQAPPAAGTLSNPGSVRWEDVLSDIHTYPRVPHTQVTIDGLRSAPVRPQPGGIWPGYALELLQTANGQGKPIFLSEYGIGSAVDLWSVTRRYEQAGRTDVEDAQFYRARLDRYLLDWKQWHLEEAFGEPRDFFAQSLAKMAGQRTLGLNAIRANPHIVGHNVTGGNDHVSAGEGLTTTFRDLKPGTVDALFEAWAPLRLCLFTSATNIYRGSTLHLEAVLANEDALLPGSYPVRLQVLAPDQKRVFDRTVDVTIAAPNAQSEPPLAMPIFAGDVAIDGPQGQYRFIASFERGAQATGGEALFNVHDAAQMPAVDGEVTLWGEDAALTAWLAQHRIRTRAFAAGAVGRREVILVAGAPAAGGASSWSELARHIARGATAIFLSPEVFARGPNPVGWLPLKNKGALGSIQGWLYQKDEWAKHHAIFEGLPSGGLMDYATYSDIIPDAVWVGQDAPDEAIAGAIKASQDYSSGLMVAEYRLGAGRFILNTLRIRENLGAGPDGTQPVAERLLRNLLRLGARDVALPPQPLPANFDQQLKEMGFDG